VRRASVHILPLPPRETAWQRIVRWMRYGSAGRRAADDARGPARVYVLHPTRARAS
jgi:hypothetical protein